MDILTQTCKPTHLPFAGLYSASLTTTPFGCQALFLCPGMGGNSMISFCYFVTPYIPCTLVHLFLGASAILILALPNP